MASVDSAAVIDVVRRELADALIATDFDGTLAPVVEDPALAVPLNGSSEVLADLAEHAGEVVVISGRPVSFLSRYIPKEVLAVGLYGLESVKDETTNVHSNAGVWRETIADVATAARRLGPDGMYVESKGLSITLHYRGRPELAGSVEEYSRQAAESAGLRRRSARMSFELHPPIDEDKGTVIRRLAANHTGPILYLGDDVGDLPAFGALNDLERDGRRVFRICVSSSEVSGELIQQADLVLNGPEAVLDFLRQLVSEPAAAS